MDRFFGILLVTYEEIAFLLGSPTKALDSLVFCVYTNIICETKCIQCTIIYYVSEIVSRIGLERKLLVAYRWFYMKISAMPIQYYVNNSQYIY